MHTDKVDDKLTIINRNHPLCLKNRLQSNVKDIHNKAIIQHGKTLFL